MSIMEYLCYNRGDIITIVIQIAQINMIFFCFSKLCAINKKGGYFLKKIVYFKNKGQLRSCVYPIY